MSGGHFDYKQHHINEIADSVEQIILNNGKPISDELRKENERQFGIGWYEKYPEELYHHKYSDEVIEKFKEGLAILRQASIYAQRIDWLLSGNDGEESFLRRLKKELEKK